MDSAQPSRSRKLPLWERISAIVIGTGIVVFGSYLVIRNEPFNDPNLVVLVRILLSLSVGLVGGLIPGFMDIRWSARGLSIRAVGAIGLFLLTFFGTPSVLPSLDGDLSHLRSQMERIDAEFSASHLIMEKKVLGDEQREKISSIYESRSDLKDRWNDLYKRYVSVRKSGGNHDDLIPISGEMNQVSQEMSDLQSRLDILIHQDPPPPGPPSAPRGLRVIQ